MKTMDILSAVSETALITLRARAEEAGADGPVIDDPVGLECLASIRSISFTESEIVFEVVHERYTKGLWKKSVESKMKRNLGSDAGNSYEFGVRKAGDIESYGEAIAVVDEWSYFEDEDIRPKFLRLFRHFRFVTRTQWTIRATIG